MASSVVSKNAKESAKVKKLESDDFICSICRDLAFKPTFPSCGHFFCFWCMHRSMNVFESSKCPYCREVFSFFPAICEPIYWMIVELFPEEFAERKKEVDEEEKKQKIESPALNKPEQKEESKKQQQQQQQQQSEIISKWMKCQNCNELTCKPCVTQCGHLFCLSCLYGTAAPTAEQQQQQSPLPIDKKCPKCSQVLNYSPRMSLPLHNLLSNHVSKEYESRLNDSKTKMDPKMMALIESTASTTTSTSKNANSTNNNNNSGSNNNNNNTTPNNNTSTAATKKPIVPITLSTFDYSQFVHFGAGCDGCGMYPIKGNRYRCKECPKQIGFDLCQNCWNAGLHNVSGRFNQQHTSKHQIEKVELKPTMLHLLQQQHPELTFDQLLQWVQMSFRPNDVSQMVAELDDGGGEGDDDDDDEDEDEEDGEGEENLD